MRLEKEIPVLYTCYTAVNNCAIERICGAVGFAFSGCIEVRVVSLTDDNNGYILESLSFYNQKCIAKSHTIYKEGISVSLRT